MDYLGRMLAFLAGKKTYIIAFSTAIYATGIQLNLWPHNVAVDLLLASGGTAALRHGISNSGKDPNQWNQN